MLETEGPGVAKAMVGNLRLRAYTFSDSISELLARCADKLFLTPLLSEGRGHSRYL